MGLPIKQCIEFIDNRNREPEQMNLVINSLVDKPEHVNSKVRSLQEVALEQEISEINGSDGVNAGYLDSNIDALVEIKPEHQTLEIRKLMYTVQGEG